MAERAAAEEKAEEPAGAEGRGAKDARALPGAGTPDGDRLREAFRSLEVGDYRRVRARCDELPRARDRGVREAAAELRARTTVDPVQVVVVLACAAFLATIAYVWVL